MPQFDVVSFFDNSLLFFIIPLFFLGIFFIVFFPEWISFCKLHKKFLSLFSCTIWILGCKYPTLCVKSNNIIEGWYTLFLQF